MCEKAVAGGRGEGRSGAVGMGASSEAGGLLPICTGDKRAAHKASSFEGRTRTGVTGARTRQPTVADEAERGPDPSQAGAAVLKKSNFLAQKLFSTDC